MSVKPEATQREDGSVVLNSNQIIVNAHRAGQCRNDKCPIHKPSDHELRGYPLYFNGRHMIRLVKESFMIDPDDFYFSVSGEAILVNSAACARCGSLLVSRHAEKFISCSCGAVAIGGGAWELKRLFLERTDLIETSLVARKSLHE